MLVEKLRAPITRRRPRPSNYHGSALAQWTSRLPPPSGCSTVAGGLPTQLVENQIPPDPFQSVMPMVSLPPGVPLSVILNCKAPLFPATVDGASGLVMSWMLALPLNCALQGEVEVAPVQPAAQRLLLGPHCPEAQSLFWH